MNGAERKFPLPVALIGSGFAGMLIALQSRINGGLGRELGNGYVAAALSFSAGLLVMCVAVLMSRQGRNGLLLSMSNVVGQLVAAVAFEAILPLRGGLTPGMLAGSAIALLAVVIAALPSRLPRDENSRRHYP